MPQLDWPWPKLPRRSLHACVVLQVLIHSALRVQQRCTPEVALPAGIHGVTGTAEVGPTLCAGRKSKATTDPGNCCTPVERSIRDTIRISAVQQIIVLFNTDDEQRVPVSSLTVSKLALLSEVGAKIIS